VISPDLTKNEKDKQGPGGGPFTNEAAGGENYNTLMSLVASPHEQGVLYSGSDDGLVHITQDDGANWKNITPKNLSDGIINSIEISPHDPATAYITVMRYKTMDLKPYIFKTTNYGASWSKITNGIDDPHTFVRVVREDKKQKGLLYAGTETGLYVSVDDGKHWDAFQLNLPIVPINDLIIQDNDLVAATAGRSFWILDDLGAIQNSASAKQNIQIFQPKDTYRIFNGNGKRPRLGQNPKSGITFDYYLGEFKDSLNLKLEILEKGTVIRTITNETQKDFKSWPGGPSKPAVLPAKKGYNRFTWDMTREVLPAVDKVFVFGGHGGSTVAPGTYTLRLSGIGQVSETQAIIRPNPKVQATKADFEEQQTVLKQIEATVRDIHESVNQMRSARKQLKSYAVLLEGEDRAQDLLEKGGGLIERIDTWERNLIQPDQKTFQDVINFNNKLNAQLLHLKGFIDTDEPKVTQGAKERLRDLMVDWKAYTDERDTIINSEMAAYNTAFKALDLPAIILKD